jgi:hypothetical protein
MLGRGTWNRTTVSGFGDLRTKLYRTYFSIYSELDITLIVAITLTVLQTHEVIYDTYINKNLYKQSPSSNAISGSLYDLTYVEHGCIIYP